MAYRFAADDLHQASAMPNATTAARPVDGPKLSPLEWSVVALAKGDRLANLDQPGRIAIAMGGLFGTRRNPRLACSRLEALRRMAVVSWRRCDRLRACELHAFIAAGFTHAHYDLLVSRIEQAGALGSVAGQRA